MEHRWIWPFELEEQIGAGAMGVVYRARFVKNDRRVALKLLPPEVAADPTLAARFQREMELLKDLKHPNIVHCFGGLCEGKQWYYAMELIDGGTVEKLIQSEGRIRWNESVRLALQACAGLQLAHNRGIIHRDIKPGNLLLTRTGQLKLGDFGLASMAAESKLTAAGKTVGSLHYMAPEQITGKIPLSPRTDLYSLGCTLHEMLVGKPPFAGVAAGEILQKHLRAKIPLVSDVVLDCPIPLAQVVARLLSKNPEDRYQSADELAADLREFDSGITVKTPRGSPRSNLPVARPPDKTGSSQESVQPGQPTRLRALATAGWLLAVVLAVLLMVRSPSSRSQLPADLMLEGLRSSAPEVRLFVAQGLVKTGLPGDPIPDELSALLSDSNPLIRVEAVRAIGRMGGGDPAIQGLLTRLLNTDDSSFVRNAAREALDNPVAQPRPNILKYLFLATLVVGGGVALWRGPALIQWITSQSPPGKDP